MAEAFKSVAISSQGPKEKIIMYIGIPKERQPSEYRVGLPPAGVGQIAALGHKVFVENGAGQGAGFANEDYERAGAGIVYSGEEVYGRADLILKVSRPLVEEMEWVRPRQTILGLLHLNAASPQLVQLLLEKQVTALAYEQVRTEAGAFPVMKPLSQIGGWMTATLAARLLQNDSGNRGVLLGGVPSVPPAEVVILGAGTAGSNAARAFLGLGAQVTLLDKDLSRLQAVEANLPHRAVTMLANSHTLQRALSFADVVVGAVRVPGSRAPQIVSRELLAAMRPGALIIDLSIDEGGCAVTSRPTTHHSPTFIEEGVVHCCIPNLPSAVARTSAYAILNAAWPYIQLMVSEGIEPALEQEIALANAVMMRAGQSVNFRPVSYSEGTER